MLVIVKVYNALLVIFVAKLLLKPKPEIPVVSVPQVTPAPLVIFEKVNPVGGVVQVVVGDAGHVAVIPLVVTVVCPQERVLNKIVIKSIFSFIIKNELFILLNLTTIRQFLTQKRLRYC